jgi:hypothetical protein
VLVSFDEADPNFVRVEEPRCPFLRMGLNASDKEEDTEIFMAHFLPSPPPPIISPSQIELFGPIGVDRHDH